MKTDNILTRSQLIDKLKNNFDIRELVCQHCYDKFGERAWQFISTELLSVLYTLRYVIFNKPIIVNNWHNNNKLSQRGLRCNMCDLVKNKTSITMSAHNFGKALDFDVSGYTSDQVYKMIKENISKFKYPIRLERDTKGWTHIDVYQPYGSEAKLVEFNG